MATRVLFTGVNFPGHQIRSFEIVVHGFSLLVCGSFAFFPLSVTSLVAETGKTLQCDNRDKPTEPTLKLEHYDGSTLAAPRIASVRRS
jgi:hypothetical protein